MVRPRRFELLAYSLAAVIQLSYGRIFGINNFMKTTSPTNPDNTIQNCYYTRRVGEKAMPSRYQMGAIRMVTRRNGTAWEWRYQEGPGQKQRQKTFSVQEFPTEKALHFARM